MCATVDSQCLEYLGYTTLAEMQAHWTFFATFDDSLLLLISNFFDSFYCMIYDCKVKCQRENICFKRKTLKQQTNDNVELSKGMWENHQKNVEKPDKYIFLVEKYNLLKNSLYFVKVKSKKQ